MSRSDKLGLFACFLMLVFCFGFAGVWAYWQEQKCEAIRQSGKTELHWYIRHCERD